MMEEVLPLAMTAEQRRSWEEDGFVICEDFLSGAEVQRLLAAVDQLAAKRTSELGPCPAPGFQVRNLLATDEAFLDLVDHPRMLPLVVDAIGTDIQIRTSHLDYRPQYPEGLEPGRVGMGDGADTKAGQRNMGWHPDLAPQLSLPLQGGPAEDHIPFMEMKVFYVLSDMRQSNCGNLWLAPGSHMRPRAALAGLQRAGKQPPGAIELRLAPGAAVIWRTAVWHCVGPQLSPRTRTIIHIGYHHRWLRPTDYVAQDENLLSRCDPVRRQLLGAMPPGRDPLGEDSSWAPASKFWQPDEDDVPLRAWALEYKRASHMRVERSPSAKM
jgi:ectoine hydroxylase-related dioxygenase (phytanoyl-CoA dioxygenase family)